MNVKTKTELLKELLDIDPGYEMELLSCAGMDHPHLGILKPGQKVPLAARHIELDKFVPAEGWNKALTAAITKAKQEKRASGKTAKAFGNGKR